MMRVAGTISVACIARPDALGPNEIEAPREASGKSVMSGKRERSGVRRCPR